MNPTTAIAEERYKFILFVSGMSPRSLHAMDNMRSIGTKHLNENYDLEIADISLDPAKAQEYQIIAIPTLIRIAPGPQRVLIGDLSDTAKVLRILDIE